jgi:rhodanese-related sulfurtransferase
VVRVGELTVAMTGANRASLDAAGISYHTIHLHPNNHAGYFPGASMIDLLVHFRAGDGLLLGAQAVGHDGVEKRIDVLATAIRGGFVVADLIDLDLAYAPPYGSAKDPVNMAGMAGENVLNGTMKLWYADDLEAVMADQLVLDVRSQAEHASGHVPGCLLVPHTQVRDRLDEVRTAAAGRRVAVMCAAGVRSYLAHRILDEQGFDSSMLSGGMLTLRATLGDRAAAVLN